MCEMAVGASCFWSWFPAVFYQPGTFLGHSHHPTLLSIERRFGWMFTVWAAVRSKTHKMGSPSFELGLMSVWQVKMVASGNFSLWFLRRRWFSSCRLGCFLIIFRSLVVLVVSLIQFGYIMYFFIVWLGGGFWDARDRLPSMIVHIKYICQTYLA